jgi:hypothetical protein
MKPLLAALIVTAILVAAAQGQIWIMTNGAAGGGKVNPVTNACASGGNTLDFSDTTGCNLVWAGH